MLVVGEEQVLVAGTWEGLDLQAEVQGDSETVDIGRHSIMRLRCLVVFMPDNYTYNIMVLLKNTRNLYWTIPQKF